jgi:carbonic anhydrase
VGVGRVSAIVLLAHTDCNMVNVTEKRDIFIRGLVEWGGSIEKDASRQFDDYATRCENGDPVEFVVSEAARIRSFYPSLLVAPLLYAVEDGLLAQITA